VAAGQRPGPRQSSHRALLDLQWWAAFTVSSNSNALPLSRWPTSITRAIFTDSSSELGYGAVSWATHTGRRNFGSWWQDKERQWHITMKELVSVRKGILAVADDLRGRSVRLWEDDQGVVHIIRNHTAGQACAAHEA
jgi:hypothetical protein